MENLLLGIKKHSEISVTILYTDYICESIQNNFVCLKFETATKNHIESHGLLIFFKEYRKSFDFTKIVFKNIKKICAVFHPIELSENYNLYNFHLSSAIITNFQTNIKKLDSITNISKFYIHQAFDPPKINETNIKSDSIGVIGPQVSQITKLLETTGKKIEFYKDHKFYRNCEMILIDDQNDFLNHVYHGLYLNKKVILPKNHFTNELKDLPVFYYNNLHDINNIIWSNQDADLCTKYFLENTSIKQFIDRLKEIINITFGFDCKNKRVSFFDAGSFAESTWSDVDQCLSKTIDKHGIRFFSCVDREIINRPDSLNEWIGILHSELDIPETIMKNNKGVFVFSEYAKSILKQKHPSANVVKIFYPSTTIQEKFNYQLFCKTKKVYCLKDVDFKNFNKELIDINSWNKYLVDGIMFLDFDDCWSFELLTQCIEKNMPVVCKKNSITEEYLGKDYPLFYNEEIDEAKILEANVYLKNLDKEKFKIANFIKLITESTIYKQASNDHKRPLLRIILGRTSKDGYEVTYYNVRSIMKCYGTDKFDLFICHNNLNQKRLRILEEKLQSIKIPIRFYKQNNSETLLPIKFSKHLDATIHHNISHGSFWKICPARIRPECHEIIIDNDIVFLKALPEIETFLQDTIPLTLEDSSIHMGVFEKTKDFNNCASLNSGIIGLPPNYNFEKKIYDTWESMNITKNVNGSDEQGLLTSILSKGNHIMIPRSHVMGLHPEKLHINAFSSGTPTYSILKRKKERDFISYSRIDIHQLAQKTFAFHFYQINRSSVEHQCWDKFLDYHRYMQSPNSIK